MSKLTRFVCIHSHFYQPPRENPWLREIEIQDSAYPFHDWNERITSECYRPISAARILGSDQRICDIVNIYSRISFNFGPTLLSWMEKKYPDLYKTILEADKESMKRFSGHGSAIAQAYSHMILPLADSHDKRTQIIWGIKDFKRRFRRSPEGMWLPETAVDLETLDIMAEMGIGFTILAPHQAARRRKIGDRTWTEVPNGRIDPKVPYCAVLPSGKRINIFFYDGQISHDIAFGGLLKIGDHFADRMLNSFDDKSESAQLTHIAADGETFGHHHRFGEMALAYALRKIEKSGQIKISVCGEFLEKNPPEHEVEILSNTSWSCAHGIERWRSDCGCRNGENPGWNQKWRAPLRKAMDWLRDQLRELYLHELEPIIPDPIRIRDEYLDILMNDSETAAFSSLRRLGFNEQSDPQLNNVLKLLETQRMSMLMYTSCGWFFDDVSRIETIQILTYAARAIQIAEEIDGKNLEPEYLRLLEMAHSNSHSEGGGKQVYLNKVKPALVDHNKIGAYCVLKSLFSGFDQDSGFNRFSVKVEARDRVISKKNQLVLGKIQVNSRLIPERKEFDFAGIRTDSGLRAGLRPSRENSDDSGLAAAFRKYPNGPEGADTLILLTRYFSPEVYCPSDLSKEMQFRLLSMQVAEINREWGLECLRFFQPVSGLFATALKDKIPIPAHLACQIQNMQVRDLKKSLSAPRIDFKQVFQVVHQLKAWREKPEIPGIIMLVNERIKQGIHDLGADVLPSEILKTLNGLFAAARNLSFDPDLWESQNIFFEYLNERPKSFPKREGKDEPELRKQMAAVEKIGKLLRIGFKCLN